MNAVGNRKMDTRKMVNLAVLSAIAYVLMLVGRIPIVLFLKYDPKDVVIAISGFIYGPMAAFGVSVVVGFIEMITVSTTGPIGFIMNVLGSATFACTASYIYKRNKSIKGALIGLVVGALGMTVVMLLWNYFITPYYMKITREAVAAMLIPAFLPFNLFKGGLNAVLALVIYKPLVTALRKNHLIPESEGQSPGNRQGLNSGMLIFVAIVSVSCVFIYLILQGII